MRFKGFAIGTAAAMAAGAFTVVSGAHSVFATCGATGSSATPGSLVGETVTTPTGCLEVGADPGHGVIYLPVGGTPTAAPGVYVVLQGSGTNPCEPGIGCALNGYVGVSDYETGTAAPRPNDTPCDSNTAGGDTNSGGSIGTDWTTCGAALPVGGSLPAPLSSIEANNGQIAGTPVYLVAPVACGNLSGPNWNGTTRDGCWEP